MGIVEEEISESHLEHKLSPFAARKFYLSICPCIYSSNINNRPSKEMSDLKNCSA